MTNVLRVIVAGADDDRAPALELRTGDSVRLSHTADDRTRNTIRYALDAEMLVDALYRCLPGGTLDQVLVTLLQRKASQFVVPFGIVSGPPTSFDAGFRAGLATVAALAPDLTDTTP